jgi:predicted DNA-binding transcriptional regulator YafY
VPDAVVTVVRRAVFAGHQLRIHYAAADRTPQWRTVNPIGLVTARNQGYLLATRSGADRTYRLSRILAAEELAEPASDRTGSTWTGPGRNAARGSGPAATRSPCWSG